MINYLKLRYLFDNHKKYIMLEVIFEDDFIIYVHKLDY